MARALYQADRRWREPEEFIEAVLRRQKFILVAEVILAELPAHVTHRLQYFGDCRVLIT